MGKYAFAAAMLLAAGVAMPAAAQDVPAAAREKPAAKPITRPSGAASASYARCAPGNPIGGIIVKGGSNAGRKAADPETTCPDTGSAGEPAEGKGRTYTGGRRNADAPSATVEAGASAAGGDMPSRLSMTPTTAKAAAAPPAPAGKSISEKGLPASRPH